MFGIGDKDKEKDVEQGADKKKEGEKPKEQHEPPADKQEPKKTTADEGKTFEAATVFVCVEDCVQKGMRYRRGDEITGKTCPPYFAVKPKEPGEDKDKK